MPGVGSEPANTNDAASASRNPTPLKASVTRVAAGALTKNSERRERPVATRSRNTPLDRSAVPASVPISAAVRAPKIRASARTARSKRSTPPAGPFIAGFEACSIAL